jgi:hypothetical protein
MKRVQGEAPGPTDEDKDWIDRNAIEQRDRYTEIVAEMNRIAPDRDA